MEAIPSKVAIERWFVKTVGFICLMACLIGGSCTPAMPPECQEFFYSGSSNDAEKEFSSYDLDKQLKIYRCGMTRRPPHTTLALLIADRGEDAVSPLLDKLETERDELSQYSIIRILAVMSLKGPFTKQVRCCRSSPASYCKNDDPNVPRNGKRGTEHNRTE